MDLAKAEVRQGFAEYDQVRLLFGGFGDQRRGLLAIRLRLICHSV